MKGEEREVGYPESNCLSHDLRRLGLQGGPLPIAVAQLGQRRSSCSSLSSSSSSSCSSSSSGRPPSCSCSRCIHLSLYCCMPSHNSAQCVLEVSLGRLQRFTSMLPVCCLHVACCYAVTCSDAPMTPPDGPAGSNGCIPEATGTDQGSSSRAGKDGSSRSSCLGLCTSGEDGAETGDKGEGRGTQDEDARKLRK